MRELRGQIGPRFLAVGPRDMFAVEEELAVDDACMAFRAGNVELDRLVDVNPAGGDGCNRAVGEADDAFASFVAARIAVSYGLDGGRGGFGNLVDEPQKDIERVRSEIAESAATRDGRIGHPAPFFVKPAAERAGMAVDVADTGDFAECASFDLLLEEHMEGLTAHEITSLED